MTNTPVLISSSAQSRLHRAHLWLRRQAPATEVLVIGASLDAASALVRDALDPYPAAFGWHRTTLNQLAAGMAAPLLTEQDTVPLGRFGARAVAARTIDRVAQARRLGRYTSVSGGPGFARAILRVIEELRLMDVDADRLAEQDPDLACLSTAYQQTLTEAGLTDRPGVFRAALSSLQAASPAHPLVGLPMAVLDVPLHSRLEAQLVRALLAQCPDAIVTVPAGDQLSLDALRDLEQTQLDTDALALEDTATAPEPAGGATAQSPAQALLGRLQRRLFEVQTDFAGQSKAEAPGDGVFPAAPVTSPASTAPPMLASSPVPAETFAAEDGGTLDMFAEPSTSEPRSGSTSTLVSETASDEDEPTDLVASHSPETIDRRHPNEDTNDKAGDDHGEGNADGVAGDIGPGPALDVFSAPGESRECVEIARRILRLAGEGKPFDRIAIVLRSPEQYRSHLLEALNRAQIPCVFSRGVLRPDPAGRAFLALLNCAMDGLSANRFSEYLSIGELPDADEDGQPPPAPAAEARWVPSDEEFLNRPVAEQLRDEQHLSEVMRAPKPPTLDSAARPALASGDPDPPVRHGTLRAPRRWERLLIEASVIGGQARWARRLEGLKSQLRKQLEEALREGHEKGESLAAALEDLEHFSGFAMPLIGALAALPVQAGWGEWLDLLSALATRALRRPQRVLAVLAELVPMRDVGPVNLTEVVLVLSAKLLELTEAPSGARYGRVSIGPVEAVRGMSFDVVFVPGLAEKLFPHKIAEEPILLDRARAQLDPGLATNQTRVAHERLALKLALGCASERVFLSYPRVDIDQSRPRVASFYTLEALRAAEGRLPDFGELAARAEAAGEARIGWPAPSSPAQAIDDAEHDLALLERLLHLPAQEAVGTARYLLSVNPHLGRALRFRARRWLRRWTPADGLVHPQLAEAREVMAHHDLRSRSFSATALQTYAACPYRFLLYAVHRLSVREVPQYIDEMDPLQRGSMVHEVQFRLSVRLSQLRLLPINKGIVDRAHEVLEEVLGEVAGEYKDDLAPAIERVWEDAIALIRADLREWLRLGCEDSTGYVPHRFELAFGLPGHEGRDPHSIPGAVDLDCGISLRGSIDLVEVHGDGRVRVTDYKTGKDVSKKGQIIGGGEHLQPVLYALAAEKMMQQPVEAGRLYYCTSRGAFGERSVELDGDARLAAQMLADTIGTAMAEPFLPAAPQERRCQWCDFKVVCGPYEEMRVARKPAAELEPVRRLRGTP